MMKNLFLIFAFMISVSVSAQHSPYISKIYDYRPAPGQFMNDVPEWEPGDTKEDIIRKVGESLINNERGLISLGAWGGYIVFGFDHPVVNAKGRTDFKILGNSFYYTENSSGQNTGGSSEPGVVYVSYDANENSLPDDEWFELAGSEYTNKSTNHDYRITYFKPAKDHQAVPDPDYSYIIDAEYIRWEDNCEGTGYIEKNRAHLQNYWPEWLEEEELIFEGSRLPDNFERISSSLYLQYPYAWGYADNAPNEDEASEMNIEWAVDKEGNPVHLEEIHFIKVQTGVNQSCGWLGESSTEILGAEDLHPDAETGLDSFTSDDFTLRYNSNTNQLMLVASEAQIGSLYTVSGIRIKSFPVYPGENAVPCDGLSKGIYLLSINQKSYKFIKH